MPSFPYAKMTADKARNDPLGPVTLNQLHQNIHAIDELARVEHLSSGIHNAIEVPWILGHLDDASPPTGYLFDTTYGGGTLARPATGSYTLNAAAGLILTAADGGLLYSAMANVSDIAIESKPHTITVEAVSATSFKFRVRELSSGLGAGDTWADVNRDIDVGIHALAKDGSASLMSAPLEKERRDFLTEQATDWNGLVGNQGIAYKAATAEHRSDGTHNLNRIAKAAGWLSFSGGSYSLAAQQGVKSLSHVGTGVVELTLDDNFTSLNTMACFPEVQPATSSELVIINGRAFNTGSGTSKFRFYIYAFDGANWARANRSFFSPMFGVIS